MLVSKEALPCREHGILLDAEADEDRIAAGFQVLVVGESRVITGADRAWRDGKQVNVDVCFNLPDASDWPYSIGLVIGAPGPTGHAVQPGPSPETRKPIQNCSPFTGGSHLAARLVTLNAVPRRVVRGSPDTRSTAYTQ